MSSQEYHISVHVKKLHEGKEKREKKSKNKNHTKLVDKIAKKGGFVGIAADAVRGATSSGIWLGSSKDPIDQSTIPDASLLKHSDFAMDNTERPPVTKKKRKLLFGSDRKDMENRAELKPEVTVTYINALTFWKHQYEALCALYDEHIPPVVPPNSPDYKKWVIIQRFVNTDEKAGQLGLFDENKVKAAFENNAELYNTTAVYMQLELTDLQELAHGYLRRDPKGIKKDKEKVEPIKGIGKAEIDAFTRWVWVRRAAGWLSLSGATLAAGSSQLNLGIQTFLTNIYIAGAGVLQGIGMGNPQQIAIAVAIVGGAFGLGKTAVNVTDWIKGRSITPEEMLKACQDVGDAITKSPDYIRRRQYLNAAYGVDVAKLKIDPDKMVLIDGSATGVGYDKLTTKISQLSDALRTFQTDLVGMSPDKDFASILEGLIDPKSGKVRKDARFPQYNAWYANAISEEFIRLGGFTDQKGAALATTEVVMRLRQAMENTAGQYTTRISRDIIESGRIGATPKEGALYTPGTHMEARARIAEKKKAFEKDGSERKKRKEDLEKKKEGLEALMDGEKDDEGRQIPGREGILFTTAYLTEQAENTETPSLARELKSLQDLRGEIQTELRKARRLDSIIVVKPIEEIDISDIDKAITELENLTKTGGKLFDAVDVAEGKLNDAKDPTKAPQKTIETTIKGVKTTETKVDTEAQATNIAEAKEVLTQAKASLAEAKELIDQLREQKRRLEEEMKTFTAPSGEARILTESTLAEIKNCFDNIRGFGVAHLDTDALLQAELIKFPGNTYTSGGITYQGIDALMVRLALPTPPTSGWTAAQVGEHTHRMTLLKAIEYAKWNAACAKLDADGNYTTEHTEWLKIVTGTIIDKAIVLSETPAQLYTRVASLGGENEARLAQTYERRRQALLKKASAETYADMQTLVKDVDKSLADIDKTFEKALDIVAVADEMASIENAKAISRRVADMGLMRDPVAMKRLTDQRKLTALPRVALTAEGILESEENAYAGFGDVTLGEIQFLNLLFNHRGVKAPGSGGQEKEKVRVIEDTDRLLHMIDLLTQRDRLGNVEKARRDVLAQEILKAAPEIKKWFRTLIPSTPPVTFDRLDVALRGLYALTHPEDFSREAPNGIDMRQFKFHPNRNINERFSSFRLSEILTTVYDSLVKQLALQDIQI